MVAVNIDDLWARGIIKYINHVSRDDIKYVCWLPDYGVMRQVSWVFYLPEEIEKCPPVAKQASLYNVVNLMTVCYEHFIFYNNTNYDDLRTWYWGRMVMNLN
jgi:hypothetical protein